MISIYIISLKASTADRFRMSWLYKKDSDESCKNECNHYDDEYPECPIENQQKAKDHCADLYDKDGRFEVSKLD